MGTSDNNRRRIPVLRNDTDSGGNPFLSVTPSGSLKRSRLLSSSGNSSFWLFSIFVQLQYARSKPLKSEQFFPLDLGTNFGF